MSYEKQVIARFPCPDGMQEMPLGYWGVAMDRATGHWTMVEPFDGFDAYVYPNGCMGLFHGDMCMKHPQRCWFVVPINGITWQEVKHAIGSSVLSKPLLRRAA